MHDLPKPKNKQAVLYLVLIALTVSVAAGLRQCAQRHPSPERHTQQILIDEDSVRYIPVHTLVE